MAVKAERTWRDYVDLRVPVQRVRMSEQMRELCTWRSARLVWGPRWRRSRCLTEPKGKRRRACVPLRESRIVHCASLASRRWGALEFTLFAKSAQQPTSSTALANETPSSFCRPLSANTSAREALNYTVANSQITATYVWQRSKSDLKESLLDTIIVHNVKDFM